ncbi:hypothetical protein GCM10010124_25320 [Pilimelia terevasa]|uniref:LysM domain-containing protein n=1 Tax=Pilimelia terevasa TaxID=53372 RepID=A0A8J3FK35_9ACTN|nr:BTAD domain-containing putative transcriptional regulator [Pilimelia terevasa]GGK31468.1 hypothetical protein GCM10010124_25320 [Pilimelia terevasa]
MLRICKAAASVLAIAALLLGVPAVLLAAGTNPWSAAIWAKENLWAVDYGNTVLLGALTLAGWIAWATCVQGFAAALLDTLTGGRRTLPAIGVQRAVFTFLLGAVITSSTTATWAAASHNGWQPRPAAVAVALAGTAEATSSPVGDQGPVVHQGPGAQDPSTVIHTVVRGEHILDLAERYYGHAQAYTRIVEANSGVTQPDGRALQPGSTRIYPGWQLRIPHATPTTDAGQQVATDAGTITLVAAGRSYDVHVHRGDNLYKIAQQWLGDGDRWPEIYQLNKHRHFDDGRTLNNPRLIFAGWTLDLPDDAQPPAGHTNPKPTTPATPPVEPAQPSKPAEPTLPATPAPTHPAPTPSGPATPPTDDGVITTTAAPQSPSTSTPSKSAQQPAPATSRPGIDLPGGGWVDAGLAAALATAAAAVWAHRNRRYRRLAGVSRRRRDADLPAVSALVKHVRARLAPTFGPRGARPATTPVADEVASWVSDLRPTGEPGDLTGADHDSSALIDSDWQPAPDREIIAEQQTPPQVEPADVVKVEPGPATPVAPSTDGEHAQVWPTAGLGLTGPGALAAARGLLVSALASGSPDDPQARTEVIIPASTLASLLGAAAVQVPNTTSRLIVTNDLVTALEELEAHALYRARLCQEYEAVSIAQFRTEQPDREFVPPLVLITDVTGEADSTRLEWSLAAHYRLDVHGVICGDWPRGDTIQVAADGTTTPAVGIRYGERHRNGHPADLGRLTVLDEAQTLEMLLTLIEAQTGTPAPRPPADTIPDSDDARLTEDDPRRLDETAASGQDQPAEVPDVADTSAESSAGPDDVGAEDTDHGDAAEPATSMPADTRQPLPVKLTVLGTDAPLDYTGSREYRSRVRELLTYLIASGGTAHEDTLFEDLLPDVTYKAARDQINVASSLLRNILGEVAGVPAKRFVVRNSTAHAVQLGPQELLDVDLWRMRDLVGQAKTAGNSITRTRLLRQAVDTYTGELAAGADYPWVDLYRERTRRDYIDAVLAFTDELVDDPAQILRVVRPAIGACPYAEALYQKAMKAMAALGDADGIRALRRTMNKAMEELGVEAEEDTRQLATKLLADLTGRRRP